MSSFGDDVDYSRHIRHTDLFVTINTHVTINSNGEMSLFGGQLRDLIEQDLNSRDGILSGLPWHDESKVIGAEVHAVGVEVGYKRQLHAHFILNLQHQTRLQLRHVNAALQDYLNPLWEQRIGGRLARNLYVSAALLRSGAAKNYASKRRNDQRRVALPPANI